MSSIGNRVWGQLVAAMIDARVRATLGRDCTAPIPKPTRQLADKSNGMLCLMRLA